MLMSAAGDPKACATVNSALDWYHGNVRLNAAGLTWHRVIGKNMKQPVSEGQAKQFLAGMKATFQVTTIVIARQIKVHCNVDNNFQHVTS